MNSGPGCAKALTECYNRDVFYDPDYLNPKATEKFVETTYEPYCREFPKAFGTVITASFDDETRQTYAVAGKNGDERKSVFKKGCTEK